MNQPCFYVPGAPNIIDTTREIGGVLVGFYSGETVEQMQARHPGAILTDINTAHNSINDAMKRPPQEITAERWDYFLEVLPPRRWINERGAETFHMSEFTCGDVTQICARIGKRYFAMEDVYTLTHDEIITKVKAAFPNA